MKKQKVFAGLDIGGSSLKTGLFSEKRELLARFSTPVNCDLKPNIPLGALIDWLKSNEITGKYMLQTIGVGIPGIFDQAKGMLTHAANLPCWVGFPVRDYLRSMLEVPVIIGNDGNMAALGEYHAGSGRELQSMIMLTLGTGVGGAIIDQGKIVEYNGFSGEIGHIIIDINGAECHCGRRGCLETMAAKSGLSRMLREALKKEPEESKTYKKYSGITPRDLSEMAADGDGLAMEVFRNSGQAVGIGLSNVLNLLRVDGVVIGGGISGAWEGFFLAIEETIAKTIFSYDSEKIKIRKASLGEDAGIYGAGVAAMQAAG